MNVPNARFWIYWGCDWVKITLRPGQTLSAYECHRTDEGHSYTAEEWEHEGERVVARCASGGSDCDGPLDRFSEWECPLGDLRRVAPETDEYGYRPERPEWVKLSASQRDAYAESMGY